MAVDPLDSLDRDRPRRFSLDKALFCIGVIYLSAVSIWLYSQQKLPWSAQQPDATAQPTLSERPLSDRQFVAYLQQSLQTLDRSAPSVAAVPAPNNTGPVYPPTALSPNSSLAERMLAPSLSPPVAIVPVAPPLSPLPQAQPSPQKLPPTVAIAPPPRPLPPPPATVPTFSAPSRALPPFVPPPPTPSSSGNHSLVGLLASGDQSTVLVTANGLTRRFALGEVIGSSGWVLTDVSQDRALISRQGKTKVVEVGQSF